MWPHALHTLSSWLKLTRCVRAPRHASHPPCVSQPQVVTKPQLAVTTTFGKGKGKGFIPKFDAELTNQQQVNNHKSHITCLGPKFVQVRFG